MKIQLQIFRTKDRKYEFLKELKLPLNMHRFEDFSAWLHRHCGSSQFTILFKSSSGKFMRLCEIDIKNEKGRLEYAIQYTEDNQRLKLLLGKNRKKGSSFREATDRSRRIKM